MEFISDLCGILCVLCLCAAPISLIVWLVMLFKRSENSKKARTVFFCLLGGILFSAIVGTATFTPCEHNWEIIENVKATCEESGKTIKRCSLCSVEQDGDEIPALGHTWLETIKQASCTEPGEHKKTCSVCNNITIEILPAQHSYTESILSKPKCEKDGAAKLICSVCGDTQNKVLMPTGHIWGEEKITTEPKCEKEGKAKLTCSECGKTETNSIAATGHTWAAATCTLPKTCSSCKATEGKSIGHTTDFGICSRCSEIVKKQSPVTIIGMRYTVDYVGGVEWTLKIKNNSEKEIKYVTLQWSCYNAVDDLITDQISGKSYVRIRFTGPLAPGKTSGTKRNGTRFYNSTFSKFSWDEITVEYMDGTTETISQYHDGYFKSK